MQITRTAKPVRQMADVKLWHCGGCGVVHMVVGKTVLNFSREEFADFTNAVADISATDWLQGDRAYSIIDLVSSDGETVH